MISKILCHSNRHIDICSCVDFRFNLWTCFATDFDFSAFFVFNLCCYFSYFVHFISYNFLKREFKRIRNGNGLPNEQERKIKTVWIALMVLCLYALKNKYIITNWCSVFILLICFFFVYVCHFVLFAIWFAM